MPVVKRERLAPYELKVKTFARRRLHHLNTWTRSRRRREPPEALLALVSSSRCGGRLVVDYLNSVPAVTVTDEILHPGTPIGYRPHARTKAAAVRHIQRSLWALPSPICGAKFTFRQLDQHGLTLDDLLALRPAVKIIILYRRSLADAFVSLEAARQANEWQRHEGAPPFSGSVRIDPAAYRSYADEVRRDYQQIMSQTQVRDRAQVIAYEDVAADAQGVFDNVILPFLGLPSSPVSARLKKQIDRPIDAVVENYPEVKELLEGETGRQEYALRSGEV